MMEYFCEAFEEHLGKDEKIKWVGKAQPFKVLEAENKKSLYCRWILTPVISVILFVVYVILTKTREVPFSMVVPIIIFGVALYIILRPILDAQILRNKRTYIVTSKRVVTFESKDRFFSLPLDKIDEVEFVHRKNGCTDVLFGKPAIRKSYSKVRAIAIMPIEKSNGPMGTIVGTAFYNALDTEKIKPLLAPGTRIIEES